MTRADREMIRRLERELDAKLLVPSCWLRGCGELAWRGRCLWHRQELLKCIRDHRAEIYKSHYWDGIRWVDSPVTREN